MNPSTQREMITNALSMGSIFAVIMYFWTRDPIQAGIMALIMAGTAYVGYWASNRVAIRLAKRARPLDESALRIAPTTERPDHVQRRRSRRRPRGRQSVHRE